MQIETTAAGDEEPPLVLCVAVLCEKLRASGAGLVAPAGVVVVGLQRGDVDVLVAAIAIECVDAVSVIGQDLGGRSAYVETGLGRPTVENDVPVGEFSADHGRIAGAQPHLGRIGFGYHLQQCHLGSSRLRRWRRQISRRPVSFANSHIASRHSARSRAWARSAPQAVIPWPAMNNTGGASRRSDRYCS